MKTEEEIKMELQFRKRILKEEKEKNFPKRNIFLYYRIN